MSTTNDFDATNPEQVLRLLSEVTYRPGYAFESVWDADAGRVGIEVVVDRIDAVTGEPGKGYGGVRWLHEHMSKSDVVRTIFGACLAYEEHEVREFFHYKGMTVFGPHIDVDALATAARHTDYKER